MSTTSPANFVRILSLDGGGIKGYTSLLILKRIFRTLRDEGNLAEEPRACDIFDVIVGTSTGGLIAVMLGRLHMTIDECIKEYETVARRIFGKKPTGGQAGKLLKGLLSSPFYDIGTLQAVIQDVLEKRGVPTDDSFRENMEPAFTGKSDVLRNYESRHPTQENYDCTIWEAASATAAAPMYFRSVKFKKQGESWYDGGLRRNNPVREAVAEFHRDRSFEGKTIGCLISIGTGVPKMTNVSASLPGFLKGCVDMLTDSETIADDFAKEEQAKLLTSQGRYYRFSVPQGMQDLEMDEVKEPNIEKLRGLTTDYLNKVGSGNEVQKCATALLRPELNVVMEGAKRLSLLPHQTCLHYVSRDYYAQRLRRFFQHVSLGRQSFVLYGMGGVGKTQIALEFAHNHESRFNIFWIRADSFPSFAHDIGRILQLLDPSSEAEANIFGPGQVELLTRARLLLYETSSQWIMVLDNADDYDDFVVGSGGGLCIDRFLPQRGRFLITTRDPRFLGGFVPADNGVRIEPMTINDAFTLMKKSVPQHLSRDLSENVAFELLEELGNLPLGIAQAAANMGELQLGVNEYVDAYRDRRDRMQLFERPVEDNQGVDDPHRSQSVLVTWELAFTNLEQRYPSSAACLKYMGLFHFRNIPEVLLRALSEFRELRDLDFKLVLKRLHQASLIETASTQDPENREYSMHPLLHGRILDRMSDKDAVQCFEEVVSIMATVFPVISFNEKDASIPQDKAFAAYLLPHALRAVSLIGELNVSNRSCARLLQVVGHFLSIAKMTSLAVTLSTYAMEMAPTVFGADNSSVHYIRKYRIKCLIADQQLEEAETECRIALRTLSTEKFKTEHPGESYEAEASTVLVDLGDILSKTKREEEFRSIVEMEMDPTLFPPNWNFPLFVWVVAKEFRRRDDLERAKQFLDKSLLENIATTSSEEAKCLPSMLLKVQVMEMIFERTEDGDPNRAHQLHDLVHLSEEVFTRHLSLTGATNRETWVAIQGVFNLQSKILAYERATTFATDLLENAERCHIDFDTAFLESAGIVFEKVDTLIETLQLSHLPQWQQLVVALEKALAEMIRYQGLQRKDFLVTPALLNVYGIHYQYRGEFAAAYVHHIQALELDRIVEKEKKMQPAGVLLYNTMLAIARQPGREEEAVQFRRTHREELQVSERIYGDLPSRLARDFSDKVVYAEAKERIQRDDLKVNDEWWVEHKDILKRTELRYGLLNIEAI